MSGLCGMILFEGPDQESTDCIEAMVSALVPDSARARAPQAPITVPFRDARASLGARIGPGSSGGILTSGEAGARHVLAFHGQIYGSIDGVSPNAGESVLLAALLDAYRRSGSSLLARLRGDFLLAYWNEGARTLELATDRFRVQSAVYSFHRGRLLFASRMASLLAAGAYVPRTIEPESIANVVTSSYIPTPRTILSSVHKLPPGSRLVVDPSGLRVEPYWEIDFRHPSDASRGELAQAVRRSLDDATAIRYELDRSSETVGTFLSGGVDSTVVTGLLQRLAPGRVRSFSIGFAESGFNEMSFARIAARSLGVEHHEYYVTPEDAMAAVPMLLDSFDEPFANASAIPTYCCARFAGEHGATTLYAGDGGDELFAGNERYTSRRAFDRYDRIPRWARENVLRPAVLAAAGVVPLPPLRKARRYLERAGLPYPERLTSGGLFAWMPRETLFESSFLESIAGDYNPSRAFHEHYRNAPASELLDREMYVDLRLAIADNDLFKVTRMTEAAGVGVRFPFLDSAVAEVAATVPAELRMERGVLRSFFKATYADLLPPEVRSKRKHGFGLPIAPWLRSYPPLRDLMRDALLGSRFQERGFIRKSGLEELLRRQETDVSTFYGTILWNLVILELWFQRHGL